MNASFSSAAAACQQSIVDDALQNNKMIILRSYVEVYLERGDERGRFIQRDLRRLERLTYARLLLNGLALGSEGPQNAP